jgi:hypothetical protein
METLICDGTAVTAGDTIRADVLVEAERTAGVVDRLDATVPAGLNPYDFLPRSATA